MNKKIFVDKPESFQEHRIKLGKRLFDIIFSLLALLILSPIYLIIAILVRIESKGSVIYVSERVGTGYDVFRFYKFRSMYQGSELQVTKLSKLNEYLISSRKTLIHDVENACPECARLGTNCSPILYIDGTEICENWYLEIKRKSQSEPAFFKVKNDPRVTRVGKFIRRTNLDELPQFYNVLRGDMSIVGNRPLPLYEAEKLTTDQWSYRFLAPAGITGLWQVKKDRFKSEEERINLDNQYAVISSAWMDIVIIFRSFPTFFRKSNF
ncbi:MAG: sugar transferase [Bacteroidales bacterium]|nr:sugar transferase [Bacteroidales bacterium]